MSLQNLLGISLEQITPEKETVRRLLDGAARHIADAKVRAISAETRFSSAYTAIRMQWPLARRALCLSTTPEFNPYARCQHRREGALRCLVGTGAEEYLVRAWREIHGGAAACSEYVVLAPR
jgi:hypothetical protein